MGTASLKNKGNKHLIEMEFQMNNLKIITITVLTVIYGILSHQGSSTENTENSNDNKILLITRNL